ncbi:MAG: DUF4115 domain-containing protein [Candidatus Omnitrophica bacterium]|nr:DUF4115 domain-containing protein [Candidatus Omnitrophota bacterium]
MESAASRLKKIRLEKGISLEEVQKKTKIHLDILKAIEGDTITNLSPVYLKSFLKIYCRFLGVDPKQYIQEHKDGPVRVELDARYKSKELKKPAQERLFDNAKVSFVSLGVGTKKHKKIFLVAAVVAIALLFIFQLKKVFIKHKLVVSTDKMESVVLPKKNLTTLPPAVVNPGKLQKSPVSEIAVTISAKENCLISLKADGHLVFRRVLEKGRSETWKAKNRIDLYVSNAGGVELVVNGQRFANLGRRGQVIKNIVITKDGLRIP